VRDCQKVSVQMRGRIKDEVVRKKKYRRRGRRTKKSQLTFILCRDCLKHLLPPPFLFKVPYFATELEFEMEYILCHGVRELLVFSSRIFSIRFIKVTVKH
jgi:hypothetical protein